MKRASAKSKVYLIGAGPGDPYLLTRRGEQLLRAAEVVFYDHLVHPELLKLCPQAESIYVGKVGHQEAVDQKEIEKQILAATKRCHHIVRLKGGDPFIFGRGGEEAEFLRAAGVAFEIVPGVTSATAVPAYAGIPLTHRDLTSSVTFVTGHEGAEKGRAPSLDWGSLAHAGTLVMLMAVKNLGENCNKLMKHGRKGETPAAIIEWGSYPRQRTLTGELQTIAEQARVAKIQPPAIVVIGEVVRLRDQLQWFEHRPLFGRRIMVTRARHQLSQISERLSKLGAEVLEVPALQLLPPQDWTPADRALKKLNTYSWFLFSSVNGVEAFFSRLQTLEMDIRQLGEGKILAVGPGTAAALTSRGLRVAGQPTTFTTDALADLLSEEEIRGKKILFPRAQEAREEIIQQLRHRGAVVDVIPVYRMEVPPYEKNRLESLVKPTPPDLLTFGSSSTVKNLFNLFKRASLEVALQKIPGVVIGPVTRQTAKDLGFHVIGTAKPHTIDGLIEEILKYFSKS